MTDATQEPPQASATTSEADADDTTGDAAPEGRWVAGISDEQLPEDLQPGEDNPLAEPLDPDDPSTRSPEELDLQPSEDSAPGAPSGGDDDS